LTRVGRVGAVVEEIAHCVAVAVAARTDAGIAEVAGAVAIAVFLSGVEIDRTVVARVGRPVAIAISGDADVVDQKA
jgi:hypothetical protein